MAVAAAFLFFLLAPLLIPGGTGSSLPVFEKGELEVLSNNVRVNSTNPTAPPRPLYVVAPIRPGKYPIFLFAHGTFINSNLYSALLSHISSHGYIVIAPLLFDAMFFMPCQLEEIDYLAQVIRWLPTGLSSQLLNDVVPDFNHLAVGGHSRGGKSAFALALGYSRKPDDLTISALVGIDPVAGANKDSRTNPKILTYQPESLHLSMPVAVIGSGLGNQSAIMGFPACAPNEVSHVEFYKECRAPKSHVVPAEFGHMDIVDDVSPVDVVNWMMNNMCKSGASWPFNSRDGMRKTVGGIVVAFLNSCFDGGKGGDEYLTILRKPGVCPAKLQLPQYEFGGLAQE